MIFSKLFRIRKEGSLTDDILFSVQRLIDGLKSKVGHSHVVGVRVDETYRYPSAPGFEDSSPLFFKNALGLLNEFPGNHRFGDSCFILVIRQKYSTIKAKA